MPEVTPDPTGDRGDDRPGRAGEESRRRAQRRDLAAALLAVIAIVGFVAMRGLVRLLAPRPTETQCAELVDRYLEHASRARDPQVKDEDIALATERSRTEPARSADLAACRDDLTAAQVECGLKAPNVDELERCLQ
jgi:hypothetical protein